MSTKKKWGHDELAHDLANKFRADTSVMVWEDMQMGPSGTQRPDVYVLPKTYSRFTPTTYEIKVSLSDFRSDVTTGKWQGYLKYSSAVVFAAPAGLIRKEDIPAGCGLILRHDDIWRMAKKPTLQRIETLPHETWMKMMIDGLQRQERDAIKNRPAGNIWLAERKLRADFGKDIAELVSKAFWQRERLKIEMEAGEALQEELRQARHQAIEMQRASIERDVARLNEEQRQLVRVLGLEEGASLRELCGAISAAARRLGADEELMRLRSCMERMQRTMNDALKPLPGETPQQRALPGQLDLGSVWEAAQ